MPAGWCSWFVPGLVRLRVRFQPQPKSVEFHDAQNRQRSCRMIMRNVKYLLRASLFEKTESAITVQRANRIKFGCQPPNDNSILSCFKIVTAAMNAGTFMIATTFWFYCSLVLESKGNNLNSNEVKEETKGYNGQKTIEEAIALMDEMDRKLTKLAQSLSRAAWDWSVNITEANSKVLGTVHFGCAPPKRPVTRRENSKGFSQPSYPTTNLTRGLKQIELLPCPTCSSNMSPIENVLSLLAQRLVWEAPPASTPDKLWQYVEASWTALPQGYIQSFFGSMPRRVAAVIANNGDYTNY
ncbi:uncharacterized protein TNCV_50071 [Trichonephila clavipes]|nr:uncharacterized protein TNCV_50071 [Trichonephila clavipes]